MKKAKTNHLESLINDDKSNQNSLWQLLKSITKVKADKNISLTVDGEDLSEPSDVAECFNNYFVNSINDLVNEIDADKIFTSSSTSPNNYSADEGEEYDLPIITQDFVVQTIRNLSCKKATGQDELSAKLLKYLVNVPIVLSSLVHILNLSIIEGIYPSDWKIARVQPIPKSGNMQCVQNYRPIAILSVLSKIIEKAVTSSFLKYLIDHGILSPNQFGFRPNHSCEIALLCMVDEWSRQVDKGELNGIAFIDLRRAFDMVDHSILLDKLKTCGCSQRSIKWFESYLRNRQQFVSIGKEKSSTKELNVGVPQGSILAPLLFSLFINDLPNNVPSASIHMYADDTTVSVSGKSKEEIEAKLIQALSETSTWIRKNRLMLNSNKTKVMLLGSKQRFCSIPDQHLSIKLHGQVVECVNEFKCLGVVIDNCLDFKKHVDYISKTIRQKLGIIRRSKHYFNDTQLSKLYWGYVIPHILYCCNVWSGRSECNYDTLNRLHKRAAYMISNCTWETRSEDVFSRLKWPLLHQIFYRASCCLMYKCIHKLSPAILYDNFFFVDDVSKRSTRNSNKLLLRVPKCRTAFYQKSFVYSGSVNWNQLPEHIRFISSVDSFKYHLKHM